MNKSEIKMNKNTVLVKKISRQIASVLRQPPKKKNPHENFDLDSDEQELICGCPYCDEIAGLNFLIKLYPDGIGVASKENRSVRWFTCKNNKHVESIENSENSLLRNFVESFIEPPLIN